MQLVIANLKPSMEITLTKHQSFELSAFLTIPSKNLPSITEVRKCNSARTVFERSTKDYSTYLKDLAKEEQKKVEAFQEEFRVYCETPVEGALPAKDQQSLKIVSLDRQIKDLRKEIEEKATAYEQSEGKIKITVTIDKNDKSFLDQYFEKEATKFSMWQSGDKIEEMATLLETK